MSDEVATVQNSDITPVGGNGSFVSSFDTTTDKGKIKIFSVLQTSERLEDHMNEPFNLTMIPAIRLFQLNLYLHCEPCSGFLDSRKHGKSRSRYRWFRSVPVPVVIFMTLSLS